MTISTPYSGGCKDGLANGHGTYRYSLNLPDRTPEIRSVAGDFVNGKLNGQVTVDGQSRSYTTTGEFRENQQWNAIAHGVGVDGIRTAIEWREGILVAQCRADGQGERNCDTRLRELMGN